MKSGDVLAGKYRLVQPIGEGAMGEVWSGENQSTGERIALKLIIASAKKNNLMDVRQRMLREARTCGKLQHPNIVRMLDVGETADGDPFLVLELLRGRTLAERLKDTRRIEPAVAARIGAEIANALAVAHAAKIIHRDLKPANIFLHQEEGVPDEHFVVKVLDFGVSKHLDGHAEGPATLTNVAVGSPVYMSPEQVALQKDLDGRTDLWSLGIVLYEMLTGARPFTGNVGEVVRQIMFTRMQKVPAPSTKVRDISPDLDAVVLRCLESNRDKRFTDAGDVARALVEIAKVSGPRRIPTNPQQAPVATQPQAPTTTAPLTPGPTRPPVPMTTPKYTRSGTEKMPEAELLRRYPSAETKTDPVELRGPGGTHVMPTKQTVASPAPTWRNEMAQWRAQRESKSTREFGKKEPQGGTLALDPGVASAAPNHRDATGTTSEVGALSKPTFEAMHAEPSTLRKAKRKRSSRLLFALMGLGLAAALTLLVVLVHAVKTDKPETPKEPAAPAPSSSPVPPALIVPAKPPVPQGEPQPSVTTPGLSMSTGAKNIVSNDALTTNKPKAALSPKTTDIKPPALKAPAATTKKKRAKWSWDNL